MVYEIGRREPFLDEKKKGKDGKPGVSLDWFNMLYQVLLGQEKGPRFGSFVAVYGIANTVAMIDGALARSASECGSFLLPLWEKVAWTKSTPNARGLYPRRQTLTRRDAHCVRTGAACPARGEGEKCVVARDERMRVTHRLPAMSSISD